MLETVLVVILILWLLGIFGATIAAGKIITLLLTVVVILLLVRLIKSV